MEWLNYHHLLYFWTVAREGSIARAGDSLRLAPPTISEQIRLLEDQLGEQLFQRTGRTLVLTDVGRLVFEYADEIFGLGRELMDTLKDRPTGRPVRFQVGITDELSKNIVYRFLQPALALPTPVRIVCREGPLEQLAGELATHALDLVISDSPMTPVLRVKAYNHALGESTVTLMASRKVAPAYRTRFPASLDGAPFLLPTENKMLRRALDQWFEAESIRPRVVGEFDDSALLKTFGQGGAGVFAVPTAIEPETARQYGAVVVGRLDSIRLRYYAISVERRLKHPAVVAVSEAAHELLSSPRQVRGRRQSG